jgi:branched-chain amino acid transport system substrate-binding protein
MTSCFITLFIMIFLFFPIAFAESGLSEKEILLGMVNAQTGPAQALGKGIRLGSQVYIDKINQAGGVHGRKLVVKSYDDGYEPRKTVGATKKLIEEDKVFALFGYVGAPTSTAIRPIISQAKVHGSRSS